MNRDHIERRPEEMYVYGFVRDRERSIEKCLEIKSNKEKGLKRHSDLV